MRTQEQTLECRDTVVVPTFLAYQDELYVLSIRHSKALPSQKRFVQGGIDPLPGNDTVLEHSVSAAVRELYEEVEFQLAQVDHEFVPIEEQDIVIGGMLRAPEGQVEKLPKRYIREALFIRSNTVPAIKPNKEQKVGSLFLHRVDPGNPFYVFRHITDEQSRLKQEKFMAEALNALVAQSLVSSNYALN